MMVIVPPRAYRQEHFIGSVFKNEYWPANFGEGNYEKSEHVLQQLLREDGRGQR